MKVISIELRNYKLFADEKFSLSGDGVIVEGRNGSGKSSILDAIEYVVGKKLNAPVVIKNGEESGSVTVKIGDDDIIHTGKISMKKGKDGVEKTTLTLETDDGYKFKSKGDISRFLGGPILFDAGKFARQQSSPANRRKNFEEVIKPMLNLDTENIDAEISELKEKRKTLGADLKAKKSSLEVQGVEIEEVEAFDGNLIDLEPIQEKLSSAEKAHSGISSMNTRVATLQETKDAVRRALEEARSRYNEAREDFKRKNEDNILELKKKLEEAEAMKSELADDLYTPEPVKFLHDQVNAQMTEMGRVRRDLKEANDLIQKHAEGDLPDLDAIRKEHAEAIEKNTRSKAFSGLTQVVKEIKESEFELGIIENSIKDATDRKRQILTEINDQLPEMFEINDLNGEDCLFYKENGVSLPLIEGQIPDSRMHMVCLRLGMDLLKQSKIRFIAFQDGSLLDKETQAKIFKMCQDEGFQLLMEKVAPEGGLSIKASVAS